MSLKINFKRTHAQKVALQNVKNMVTIFFCVIIEGVYSDNQLLKPRYVHIGFKVHVHVPT